MNQLMNYQTRKAELKDVMFFYEAICFITGLESDINDFNKKYKGILKDKSAILMVIEADGKTVGCIMAQIRQQLSDLHSFVEIQELYISPKFRNHKAADFLYNDFEVKYIQKKHKQIKVNCNVNSTLNQNFYIKKGFKIFKKQYKKELNNY